MFDGASTFWPTATSIWMAMAHFPMHYCWNMRWNSKFCCSSLPPGKPPASIDRKAREASALWWIGWKHNILLSMVGKNTAQKCATQIALVSFMNMLFLFWFKGNRIGGYSPKASSWASIIALMLTTYGWFSSGRSAICNEPHNSSLKTTWSVQVAPYCSSLYSRTIITSLAALLYLECLQYNITVFSEQVSSLWYGSQSSIAISPNQAIHHPHFMSLSIFYWCHITWCCCNFVLTWFKSVTAIVYFNIRFIQYCNLAATGPMFASTLTCHAQDTL